MSTGCCMETNCTINFILKNNRPLGSWLSQLVERPTSAQVIISQFVSLSPTLGSVLTAQRLEPASDSVSPPLSAPPLLTLCETRGVWVAQSVKRPTSAQVMISRSVSSSPTSCSVLTAQSLEPASDSVSPPLSAPPLLVLSLCLSKNE